MLASPAGPSAARTSEKRPSRSRHYTTRGGDSRANRRDQMAAPTTRKGVVKIRGAICGRGDRAIRVRLRSRRYLFDRNGERIARAGLAERTPRLEAGQRLAHRADLVTRAAG